jgi:hypothetical protein
LKSLERRNVAALGRAREVELDVWLSSDSARAKQYDDCARKRHGTSPSRAALARAAGSSRQVMM